MPLETIQTTDTVEVTLGKVDSPLHVVLNGDGIGPTSSVMRYNKAGSDYPTTARDHGTYLLQASLLEEAAANSGNRVMISNKFACCPVLIDSNNEPIFVYEFVQALDGIIDYDDVKERFNTLSYAQIGSAMSFLRKLTGFNIKGIDLDELDADDANDPELIESLKAAFADKDFSHVLYHD